jgi:hypothetical protein
MLLQTFMRLQETEVFNHIKTNSPRYSISVRQSAAVITAALQEVLILNSVSGKFCYVASLAFDSFGLCRGYENI